MDRADGQWMCAGGEGMINQIFLSIFNLSIFIQTHYRFFLYIQSGRDVCAGFGGAPLVIKENGVYLQVGIMSFGSDNCGGRNTPRFLRFFCIYFLSSFVLLIAVMIHLFFLN